MKWLEETIMNTISVLVRYTDDNDKLLERLRATTDK